MNDSIIKIEKMGFPWQTQDPFLFCAHHQDFYPEGNGEMGPKSVAGRNIGQDFTLKDGWRMYHGQRIPGFPAHPHRGFETVTIAKTGLVDHSDSLGAAGRFGNGDVQWMTAGNGVQHCEMFPLLNDDAPNPLEIFQIWLNLPRENKGVEAHFAMLWHEDIPVIDWKDENGKTTTIDVIAGNFNGTQAQDPAPNSWAANPVNHVNILTLKMDPGAEITLPAAPDSISRTLYFYNGSAAEVAGTKLPFYHRALLKDTEDIVLKNGDETGYFLLLEGRPINEPVVQHGPFVMNTEQDIRDTMRQYGKTQFGGWPWPTPENVHDKNRGRFALHADGRLEEKDKQ